MKRIFDRRSSVGCFHLLALFLLGCGDTKKPIELTIPPGLEKARYPVYSKGLMGYIDAAGRVRIPINYELVGDEFVGDLAPVRTGGRWGYVDLDGKMVISPQFNEAYPFENGKALVRDVGGEWYLIDDTGKAVFKIGGGASYHRPRLVKDLVFRGDENYGQAWDARGAPLGWYKRDQDGRLLAEQFIVADTLRLAGPRGPRPFYEPTSRLYGYKDEQGAVVIAPRFSLAREFNEGLAAAREGTTEKWILIDTQGNPKADVSAALPGVSDVMSFSDDGLAALHKDVPRLRRRFYGYVDREGRLAIPATLLDASYFNLGLAWVVTLSPPQAGYINKKGQMVWSFKIPIEALHVNVNSLNINHIPYRFRGVFSTFQEALGQ